MWPTRARRHPSRCYFAIDSVIFFGWWLRDRARPSMILDGLAYLLILFLVAFGRLRIGAHRPSGIVAGTVNGVASPWSVFSAIPESGHGGERSRTRTGAPGRHCVDGECMDRQERSGGHESGTTVALRSASTHPSNLLGPGVMQHPSDPHSRARLLESEGDALVYGGDSSRAKVEYGRAIDAFVEAREFDDAIRTCRKLIRIGPDVVRTHFTLAYLLIGRRATEEVALALRDYLDAVRREGVESFAGPRLALLAYVTDDAKLQAMIGEMLVAIRAAERVPDLGNPRDVSERWERLLPIVLKD